MTFFLHLTDLHVSAPDLDDPTLESDTTARLSRMVDLIGAMDPAPAFVVASGDLTNHGQVESYAHLKALLAPLRMPVFPALGNHDRVAGFRAVFSDYPGGPQDTLDHDAVLAGVHLITLDTGREGHIGGMVSAAQADFLSAAMARHSELPKILVLHHAPMPGADAAGDIRDWRMLGAADTRRLSGALAGRKPAAILSGHIHIDRLNLWQGIPVLTNLGLHSTMDPMATFGPDLRIVNGAGYAMCHLTAEGLNVQFAPLFPGDLIRTVPRDMLHGRA